jgi:hypothetical protein
MCFEKMSLIKQQLPFCSSSTFWKALVYLQKIFQMCQNQRLFVYFTKITADTWYIIKIIPVSIALMEMIQQMKVLI